MKIEINEDFKEKYLVFLQSLSKENEFEYYPASEGLTRDGENISLGFSCFALKSFHILNEWENLSENKKQEFFRKFFRKFFGVLKSFRGKLENMSKVTALNDEKSFYN